MLIAALFVANPGCYIGMPDVEAWDQNQDARRYAGRYPVVAHPPCQLWGRFANVNYARWGGEHNKPGNDQGCFESALASVNRCGGVLEHPAFSDAWKAYGLPRPDKDVLGWQNYDGLWVCEVWQSAYGHAARKRTWLFYRGERAPADLSWERCDGSHQIGFHDQRGKDRNKPTLSGRRASATPPLFRDALLRIARSSCHG
jgi:hypothetical protein